MIVSSLLLIINPFGIFILIRNFNIWLAARPGGFFFWGGEGDGGLILILPPFAPIRQRLNSQSFCTNFVQKNSFLHVPRNLKFSSSETKKRALQVASAIEYSCRDKSSVQSWLSIPWHTTPHLDCMPSCLGEFYWPTRIRRAKIALPKITSCITRAHR